MARAPSKPSLQNKLVISSTRMINKKLVLQERIIKRQSLTNNNHLDLSSNSTSAAKTALVDAAENNMLGMELLPTEIWINIASFLDYHSYQNLRQSTPRFYYSKLMPKKKTVGFEEYKSLLQEFGLEKWEEGLDFSLLEQDYWYSGNSGRFILPKVKAFQENVRLWVWKGLSQEEYLYICRNDLANEVCRISTAVLQNPNSFQHIDLAARSTHFLTLIMGIINW
jgi:hypothetical protein